MKAVFRSVHPLFGGCVLLAAAVLLLVGTSPVRAGPRFVAGRDYRVVDHPETLGNPKQVEVAEVFWYGCPHCYHFEPMLERWLRSHRQHIHFVRIPASLNPSWRIHARAYYVAQALGVMNLRFSDAIFKAIHQDHHPLSTEAALRQFFVHHGVSARAFDNAFHSFTVDFRLRRADHLVRLYGIMGVPALVVDGRYVTSPDMAGGEARALKVVDFLIAKARAEKG